MPPKRPKRLSSRQKIEIIQRRGSKSDKTGKRYRPDNLEIHHKDRNPGNNNPDNLTVLTPKEHDTLHKCRV